VAERFLTGMRSDDIGDVFQHRADGEQVALIIIDDEDTRPLGRLHLDGHVVQQPAVRLGGLLALQTCPFTRPSLGRGREEPRRRSRPLA
jgi:hypothetical protein